jgi:hypothetical protein
MATSAVYFAVSGAVAVVILIYLCMIGLQFTSSCRFILRSSVSSAHKRPQIDTLTKSCILSMASIYTIQAINCPKLRQHHSLDHIIQPSLFHFKTPEFRIHAISSDAVAIRARNLQLNFGGGGSRSQVGHNLLFAIAAKATVLLPYRYIDIYTQQ